MSECKATTATNTSEVYTLKKNRTCKAAMAAKNKPKMKRSCYPGWSVALLTDPQDTPGMSHLLYPDSSHSLQRIQYSTVHIPVQLLAPCTANKSQRSPL